jgi:hypothetical protein
MGMVGTLIALNELLKCEEIVDDVLREEFIIMNQVMRQDGDQMKIHMTELKLTPC